MPIETVDELRPVITYPRDAIVTRRQIAAALDVGERTVAAMDLPFFTAGREARFCWGQVLDVLAERALPTVRANERAAASKSIRKSA